MQMLFLPVTPQLRLPGYQPRWEAAESACGWVGVVILTFHCTVWTSDDTFPSNLSYRVINTIRRVLYDY